MKRKAGLFLLAVMVAVSLGATIVASLAMYRLVSGLQDDEIHKIEASLTDRFAVFEDMLRSEHERITAHMAKVLPQIAAELERLGRKPADLSVDELDALTKKYGIQHIYFIDRAYTVFQTNLADRHEPRLSQGRVQGVPRFGVRRRQGHERRHRPVPGHGHAQDLQLLRPQGQRLHHRDLDRRPRPASPTATSPG